MKSFSHSYGLSSLKSRVNTGTKLHKDRGVDCVSYSREYWSFCQNVYASFRRSTEINTVCIQKVLMLKLHTL